VTIYFATRVFLKKLEQSHACTLNYMCEMQEGRA